MKYKYDESAEKEYKRVNNFKTLPKGFIIFDSYNNEWFPMKMVKVDKIDFSLRILKDEFHRTYGGTQQDLFLPWHYTVEIIGKGYFAINNRPIMYKSQIPGYEDYISICIVGDSNSDIYMKEFYKTIAHTIMNPIHYIPGWKLNPDGNTVYHNLGNGFKSNLLENNFR